MRTRQEIEWVSGVYPETGAIKIVAVQNTRENRRWVAQAQWDGEKWRVLDWSGKRGEPLLTDAEVLIAWADVEPPARFPTQGQSVEFTNAHRCDQNHLDPVVERLILAVGVLGREANRKLSEEYAQAGLYERVGINGKLKKFADMDQWVRTGKDGL